MSCVCNQTFDVDDVIFFENRDILKDGYFYGIGKIFQLNYDRCCSICGLEKYSYDVDLFLIKITEGIWTNTNGLLFPDKNIKDNYEIIHLDSETFSIIVEECFEKMIEKVSSVSFNEIKVIFDDFFEIPFQASCLEETEIYEIRKILLNVKSNLQSIVSLAKMIKNV